MRPDLLALGPDALAKLTNVGLVKRATADVQSGRGPAVEEEADGAVVGRCPDGAVTRIQRGAEPVLGQCTCGAIGACRHRLATVLAYQQAQPAAPVEISESVHPARERDPVEISESVHPARERDPVEVPWDPGSVDDATLGAACGADAVQRARRLIRATFVVEVRPGPPPEARLPASTVQFLVPRELGFARCDCARGSRCEHVVAAVWAFRRAPGGGLVELGAGASPSAAALDLAEAVAWLVVAKGIAHLPDPGPITDARIAAEAAGLAWLSLALQDLERHKEWYDQQSARFDPRHGPRLVAEVVSRARAGRGGGALPAAFVLGANEARETWIDTVRWVGLGARLDADGLRRSAEVWLADPVDGQVLLARGEWSFEADPPNGPALGERFVSSRMSVASLVGAEVVVRGARRHPDGRCDLGTARSMKATSFRGAPRWSELPPAVRIGDLAAFARASAAEPPALLAPRRRGARIRVVEIGGVDVAGWSASDQEAVVVARDLAGEPLVLRAAWRTVAPGAPRALLAAAPDLKFAAGELRRRAGRWEMAPIGLATAERVIAPDLAAPGPVQAGPAPQALSDPLGEALAELAAAVERAVHTGAGSVDLRGTAERLSSRGFSSLARRARSAIGDAGWVDLVVAAAWAEVLG